MSAGVLEISLNIDSPLREVLEFKTCCGLRLAEQNLEIMVRNRGGREITVLSRLELFGPARRVLLENLHPQPSQVIPPGEARAFYCYFEGENLQGYERAAMWDEEGMRYEMTLPG